jgi:MATE family multidrug resistance protein
VLRHELRPTLRLALPVILAELGWMAMGVVDTIMVGPLGPAAIGATGIGNSLYFGFAVFGMGLLLGLDTLVSQAYGARDLVLCRRWLGRGVELALLMAVPLMVVLLVVRQAIPVLGFHAETLPLLRGYFSILIVSTPFLLLYAAFRRYLQSTHHVGPVMFALVSANLINGLANWTLIYGKLGMPALGVPGAAWATTASRVYMCAVLGAAVWWANRHEPALTNEHPSGTERAAAGAGLGVDTPKPTPRVTLRGLTPTSVRRLIDLGLPAASTVTAEVGVFALSTALAGRLEPVAIASHHIAMNIAAVAFMIPLGLASAGAVRVGNAVGAGNPRGAAAAGWTVIVMGVTFMMMSGTLFVAAPRTLIGFFTQDAAVLTLGASLLAIAAVFQLFDGLQGVVTGTLRGLGDTRTPMVTNLGAHWLVGLPIGYTLCFVAGWGAPGLWWGLSAGLIVAGVVLLVAWARRVGRLQTDTGREGGLHHTGRLRR